MNSSLMRVIVGLMAMIVDNKMVIEFVVVVVVVVAVDHLMEAKMDFDKMGKLMSGVALVVVVIVDQRSVQPFDLMLISNLLESFDYLMMMIVADVVVDASLTENYYGDLSHWKIVRMMVMDHTMNH